MVKTGKTFILGVLAGISISLGGTVYLLSADKTVGALLFSVGLFCVCVFGFNLFTGKVCYVLDNDAGYARMLPAGDMTSVRMTSAAMTQALCDMEKTSSCTLAVGQR